MVSNLNKSGNKEEEKSDGLQSFDAPEVAQVATFESDELTALCPFNFGGPDYYDVTIRYETDNKCLESRSLKRMIESYRDEEITAEMLADDLYHTINEIINPTRLYIRLEQARRGGIEETIEVGDIDLRR